MGWNTCNIYLLAVLEGKTVEQMSKSCFFFFFGSGDRFLWRWQCKSGRKRFAFKSGVNILILKIAWAKLLWYFPSSVCLIPEMGHNGAPASQNFCSVFWLYMRDDFLILEVTSCTFGIILLHAFTSPHVAKLKLREVLNILEKLKLLI